MTTEDEAELERLANGSGPERELLASARADAPTTRQRELVIERVLVEHRRARRARRVGVAAALGAALGLAGVISLSLRGRPLVIPKVVAEPPLTQAASSALAAPPAASSAPASDPLARCTPAAVAAGTTPLIDDFEDGDGRVALNEKRAGNWLAFNDGTSYQAPVPGTTFRADRIVGGRGDSRFGLHSRGGKFSKWGAVVAVELNPRRCYDASVYSGVEFWARGRGRIRVAAKMTQVVSEEFGGSCVEKCFDSHLVERGLSASWQRYVVRWSELAQSGFGAAIPFDPASLYSLEFSVTPEQTPFDFWLDDVAFVRDRPSP